MYELFLSIMIMIISPNGALFTFDDGPHIQHTPKVLDVLKKHKVTAIFCIPTVMLNDPKRLKIAKRIVKEGHIICNHSHRHGNFKKMKAWKQKWEIIHAQKVFKKKLGVVPLFFRPPFGIQTRTMRYTVRKLNMKILMWDVDSEDWKLSTSKSDLYNKTIRRWKWRRAAGKSSTLLFHDTNWKTARVIDKIITRVKQGP